MMYAGRKRVETVHFLIYSNPASSEARCFSGILEQMLQRKGQQIAARELPETADVIAVLGGDGTVLRAVRAFQRYGKPIWAVNCGHLGYLTDCSREEAGQALDRIIKSDYTLEYRTRLKGEIKEGNRITAMNELLLHRGACVHALSIEVLVNGSTALKYRGDGLIICTPSGSTAYNLSAGGPVLMPEMKMMALTPICPQSVTAVPIVISSRDTVRISWYVSGCEDSREKPDLTADGQEQLLLPLEGSLSVKELKPQLAFIRTRKGDFYGRLQQRMHWNLE